MQAAAPLLPIHRIFMALDDGVVTNDNGLPFVWLSVQLFRLSTLDDLFLCYDLKLQPQ